MVCDSHIGPYGNPDIVISLRSNLCAVLFLKFTGISQNSAELSPTLFIYDDNAVIMVVVIIVFYREKHYTVL